jgi:hypothetical protein
MAARSAPLALDLDPEPALAFTIENCSFTRIDRIDGPSMGHGWRVVRVNEPLRCAGMRGRVTHGQP